MAREKSKRPRIDWDALEPHYRAGIRSLKDIGQEFGATDAAIIKHARIAGWDRNLLAKIQAKADAKVSAALVSAEVSETKKLTESIRVEIESEVQARIRLTHRADITKVRLLCINLLGELESETGNLPALIELGEILRNEDGKGQDKLNDIYRAAISLPERSKTLKALVESLKSLVGLEREAYGIAVEATKVEVTGAGGGNLKHDITATVSAATSALLGDLRAGSNNPIIEASLQD